MANPLQKSKNVMLCFLTLIVWLGVYPLDVILPSVSSIADDFLVSPADIAISVSTFAVGAAVSQLLLGPLSDCMGRKRLLLAGLLLSGASATAAAISSRYECFFAFRVVQSIGCGCFVLVHAIVEDFYDVSERVKVRIYLSTMGGVFIAASPLFGSWLENIFGWTGSFYVFSILSFAVVVFANMILAPDSSVNSGQGFKALSARIFWEKEYLSSSFVAAVAFSCHFSFIVVSPLIFIERLELSSYNFSLILLVYGLAYVVGGAVAVRLHTRVSLQSQVTLGLVLITVSGVLLCLLVRAGGLSVAAIILPAVICTVGTTIARPAAFTIAMSKFPHNSGAASAVASTIIFLVGGSISAGIAMSGEQLVPMLGVTFVTLSISAFLLQQIAKNSRRPPIKRKDSPQ